MFQHDPADGFVSTCQCQFCPKESESCDDNRCFCYTCEEFRAQSANRAIKTIFKACDVLDATYYMDELYDTVADLLSEHMSAAHNEHFTYDTTTCEWKIY